MGFPSARPGTARRPCPTGGPVLLLIQLHPGLELGGLGHFIQFGLVGVLVVELLVEVRGTQDARPVARLPTCQVGRQGAKRGRVGQFEGEVIDDLQRRRGGVGFPIEAELPHGAGVEVGIEPDIFDIEAHILGGQRRAIRELHALAHRDGELFTIRGDFPAFEDIRHDRAQILIRIMQQALGIPVVGADAPNRVEVDHAHFATVDADGIAVPHDSRAFGQTLIQRRQFPGIHSRLQQRWFLAPSRAPRRLARACCRGLGVASWQQHHRLLRPFPQMLWPTLSKNHGDLSSFCPFRSPSAFVNGMKQTHT